MTPAQHSGRTGGRPSRRGYALAIVVSAIGHVAIFILVIVVIPQLWPSAIPPVAYTVKIVDSIPAGDLGTHLPRLSQEKRPAKTPAPEETRAPQAPATPPPENPDKDAIALNSLHPTPTPTPRPTLTSTPAPTPPPKPRATPTPRPLRKHPVVAAPTPTATRTPRRHLPHRATPAPTPHVAIAKAEATPDLREKLEAVRAALLADQIKQLKAKAARAAEANGANAPADEGGPVAAKTANGGHGYGVGPGNGSAGIQQDAGFLLYYQEVQKQIKDAWSFAGDNPDLTATVTFGINPDGSLNSIKVAASSRDPAFDDSVVRAIRRAAPFAPPPEKYRTQFAAGVEAVFKLSELNS